MTRKTLITTAAAIFAAGTFASAAHADNVRRWANQLSTIVR
jgi:hypothetical protein